MVTLSQKWIRCPKNGYTVPKMETLSQKWIHCPKNGYIVPKMDTLSQKWIHCPKNGHTVPKMDTLSQKWVHCPNSNLNLRIRTKPVTDGADAAVLICFLGQNYSFTQKQKPDIYRCICSSRDRRGFSAEVRISCCTL